MHLPLSPPHVPISDADLLSLIQNEFPLTAQPYAEFAKKLGVPEELIIERIAAAREAGTIRQISAIFDTRHLGYKSSLVAAKVPVERQDEAAAIFSAHPGVSHNYLREARLQHLVHRRRGARLADRSRQDDRVAGPACRCRVDPPAAHAEAAQDWRRP